MVAELEIVFVVGRWTFERKIFLFTLTFERLSQHLRVLTCKVLHEFILVDTLLSFSQDGHKGNDPEWSLGSIIIWIVVLKIETCLLSLHVNYCHTIF